MTMHFERAVLTSTLTRLLVEELLAKYLQAAVMPHLDLIVEMDKKQRATEPRNG